MVLTFLFLVLLVVIVGWSFTQPKQIEAQHLENNTPNIRQSNESVSGLKYGSQGCNFLKRQLRFAVSHTLLDYHPLMAYHFDDAF